MLVLMGYNGLAKCCTGFRSTTLSSCTEPIRLFSISNFLSNRQRRIGGVATTSRSPKKPLKPVWHLAFVGCSTYYLINAQF